MNKLGMNVLINSDSLILNLILNRGSNVPNKTKYNGEKYENRKCVIDGRVSICMIWKLWKQL